MTDYVMLTGRSNIKLANDIGKILGKSVECCVSQFANTESRVQIKQRVNGKDVFIVQTGAATDGRSVNDHLMDTLLIMDTCRRAECNKIYLILALYPYSRQDKKVSRSPISARVVGKIIDLYDARVLTLDLHSGQSQGFIDRVFHNFYGTKIFTSALKSLIINSDLHDSDYILVSPDYGGSARVDEYAKVLKLKHIALCKLRDNSKPNTIEKTTIPMMSGSLYGKTAIIIDDMGDTMGTMISCCKSLKDEYNMRDAIIVLTHGIFSGPAISRINECSFITKIMVTDTLPQEENLAKCSKLEVITAAPLFAKAINLIIDPDSKGVSSLFHNTSITKKPLVMDIDIDLELGKNYEIDNLDYDDLFGK